MLLKNLGKTNCLTHIPNDINLELNNRTLTLKAGSKVYVPNGFEADGVTPKFDEVVIENDETLIGSWGTNGSTLIYLNSDKHLYQIGLITDRVSSGSTAPTATNAQLWYDTTNNIIKKYSGGSLVQTGCSLPIALCNKTDGTESTIINSIDQVFNGFGYIGSTVYALPGVKGLIPNGWNEAGRYNNIEFENSTVKATTYTTQTNQNIFVGLNDSVFWSSYAVSYQNDINFNKNTVKDNIELVCEVGRVSMTSGKITSLTINPVQTKHDYKTHILSRKKKLYYKYSKEPNATINGSFGTVLNGIASGFSTSNYLTLPSNFYPDNNTWEAYIKFTVKTPTTSQHLLTDTTQYAGFALFIMGEKSVIKSNISTNGTSWNVVLEGTTKLVEGSTYIAKLEFTGASYNLYLGTDINSLNLESSVASSTKIAKSSSYYLGLSYNAAPCLGSIDLTESYIKINGQDWWHGTKAVKSTINDYDFYKSRLVAYHPIVRKRSYYKQILNKRDTGTYTFTLDKEYNAKLLFVGNGAGGGSSQRDSKWYQSSGGSGACFEGVVKLTKGTYTVTLGTLGYGYNINNQLNCGGGTDSTDSYLTDSNGNELIRVGCGARGTSHTSGGVGGTLTLGTIEVLETIKAKNGNQGNNINNGSPSSTSGYALSVYDNTKTGYGAGTGSWRGGGNVYGIAGVFNLILETDINDYDYYEDIGTKIY